MRNRARSKVWVLAIPSALAACIPSRDNPLDPSIAPTPALEVLAWTDPSDLPCGDRPLSGEGWRPVLTATRGTCLALDARATTDPQDDALHFRWFHVGTAGRAELSVASGELLADSAGRAVLAPAFVRSVALGRADFAVEAYDDGNAHRGTTAPVELRNARPVAVLDGSRILPLNGFLWTPLNTPIDVTIDGRRSYDEDGDLLSFLWEVPSGPVTEDRVQLSMATDVPSSVTVTLQVSDGFEWSAPAFSTVAVGRAPVWSKGQPGEVLSFDGTRGPITGVPRIASAIGGQTYFLMDGANGRRLVWLRLPFGGLGGWQTASWPDGTQVGSGDFSADAYEYGTASLGTPGILWTLAWTDAALDTDRIRGWTLAGDVLTPGPETSVVDVSVTPLDPGSETPLLAAGASAVWWGRLSVGDDFYGAPVSGDAAGAPSLVDVDDPDRILSDISVRPGLDEAWAFYESATGDPIPAVIRRARLDAAGNASLDPTVIALPTEYFFTGSIRWVDEDRFWMVLWGDSLRLVDATLLDLGATFDDATLIEVPSQGAIGNVTALPDGSVWATDFPSTALHVLRTGVVHEYPFVTDAPQIADDRTGEVLFRTTDSLYRARSPDPAGRVARIPMPSSSRTVSDFAGGVHAHLLGAHDLSHFGQDGNRDRRDRLMRDPQGELATIYDGLYTRVSPGGSLVWINAGAATNLGLYLLELPEDPREPPTVLEPAPLVDAYESYLIEQMGFLAPSVPDGGTPFTWYLAGEGFNFATLRTVDRNGVVVDRFTVPSAEVGQGPGFTGARVPRSFQAGARSLSTNRVCFATLSRTDGVLRVRRVEPALPDGDPGQGTIVGSIASLPDPAMPANPGERGRMGGVATAGRAGEETCFVAWNHIGYRPQDICTSVFPAVLGTGFVASFPLAGGAGITLAPVPLPEPGVITGIEAPDEESLWVSYMSRCGAGNHRIRWVVDTQSEMLIAPLVLPTTLSTGFAAK